MTRASQLVQRPDGAFALVAEVNDGERNRNQILFATSDTVDGAYQGKGPPERINGRTTGDHSVFVDGDKAHLVYVADASSTDISTMVNVTPLTGDWTSVGPAVYSEWYAHKEAPAIQKANGKYYLLGSGLDYWNATATSYRFVNSAEPTGRSTARPGGRSERVRAAVHHAVLDMLSESETEELTVPAID
ncbi:family 43 glycosylhydrolase [Streptomyces cyaneofuscatus]|uniref:family 43 glycosylhydrolase n=1 Tax=Streptomyces cyaneofuscatus TaxID=66883 RepID=UPI003668AFAF